eukprot:gnl/TRDRNA2_/TRDRNA2_132827_c6_seq1.p1 gnl/TRDRNA2_/TRDRNA2_132827_c6~~gnl/TRDRNA2_/TRDRNA2_132827_c6_seq1.p1  ORF type:complete len:132 (+),score=2.42 gnl/TRDRNA2_/TRDRNA2_132827_c6_seq1:281-676(+)
MHVHAGMLRPFGDEGLRGCTRADSGHGPVSERQCRRKSMLILVFLYCKLAYWHTVCVSCGGILDPAGMHIVSSDGAQTACKQYRLMFSITAVRGMLAHTSFECVCGMKKFMDSTPTLLRTVRLVQLNRSLC